jgi:hypothetical protein
LRNRIERFFNRLKNSRRVACPHDLVVTGSTDGAFQLVSDTGPVLFNRRCRKSCRNSCSARHPHKTRIAP